MTTDTYWVCAWHTVHFQSAVCPFASWDKDEDPTNILQGNMLQQLE
jgi:hypothetical protein